MLKNTQKKKNNYKWLILVLLVIVLISLVYFLVSRSSKNSSQNNTVTQTSQKSSISNNNQNSSSKSTITSSQTNSSTTTVLIAPSGLFVSNHIQDNNSSSNIQSICLTTPGANCNISFTMGNTTISLGVKTADKNGYVSWQWNTKDQNISSGTWQIKATTTLNGQTKITVDQSNLMVQ